MFFEPKPRRLAVAAPKPSAPRFASSRSLPKSRLLVLLIVEKFCGSDRMTSSKVVNPCMAMSSALITSTAGRGVATR